MDCKKEPIEREQAIARYLSRSLDSDAVEEFEGHYLGCDECFDELRVSERLAAGLRSTSLTWNQSGGVSVLRFKAPTQLTHSARELEDLRKEVLEQNDTRVIIDLSRVTRIDSAGLGQLMSCYSHLVKNRGALKVVNAAPEIKHLLDMTGISKLIPTFQDEEAAVSSFDDHRYGQYLAVALIPRWRSASPIGSRVLRRLTLGAWRIEPCRLLSFACCE